MCCTNVLLLLLGEGRQSPNSEQQCLVFNKLFNNGKRCNETRMLTECNRSHRVGFVSIS